MCKNIAIILSAGKGTRLKSKIPKQFIKINGVPIICYTIKNFEQCKKIDDIFIVISKEYDEFFKSEILDKFEFSKIRKVIIGGVERAFSVKNALNFIKKCNYNEDDIVLIHDGARPFIDKEIITKSIYETVKFNAVVVGVKAKDTVKISNCDNFINKTPNRDYVWIAQTPQLFKLNLIQKAYENVCDNVYTDDSCLVEKLGFKVKMFEGSYENIKITTLEDLDLARLIINKNNMCL